MGNSRNNQPGGLYLGLSICATKLKQQEPGALNSAVIGYPCRHHKQVVVNVEVKPSRLLSACSFLPRATLRLPPVTYIGKPLCIAFQANLSCPLIFRMILLFKRELMYKFTYYTSSPLILITPLSFGEWLGVRPYLF